MKIISITFTLVTVTASLFANQLALDDPSPQCLSKAKRTKKSVKEEALVADVIVVGAGAAGCILMNKLSKNGQFSVLGIEAGPNITHDPAIEAVGLPAFLLAGTNKYNYFWSGWNQTMPMAGLNGRSSDWTTGFGVGGGSAITGEYVGRGSNAVYSRWEKISGSKNWSLKKILKTFNELENYEGLTITPGARGNKGPVHILQTPTVAPLTANILLPATLAAFPGIPVVEDYNDPSVTNCIDPRAQWFINETGTKRVSSATAFLNHKVMTRDGHGVNGYKLHLLMESVVTKILFNKDGRARGVQYIKNGKRYKARARKAVVLASGIHSSKLLQLSGIGPKKALKKAGIKPLFINENVGKGLKNHPLIFITMQANPSDIGIPPDAPYAFTIHNVYLPVVGGTASDPRMLQMLFEYIPAGMQGPSPFLVIGFDLVNPKSEGSVTIQSNNPFQIAAVTDNFYQDPVDLANMKNAVKVYIKALLEQLALFGYTPILTDPINLVKALGYDDTVVELYVKTQSNLSLDIHHFTSHCKMAPRKNGGTVNGNTRVYGTKNVYVADCSICPEIPDINTTESAMMIGWRVSELLERILSHEKEVARKHTGKSTKK